MGLVTLARLPALVDPGLLVPDPTARQPGSAAFLSLLAQPRVVLALTGTVFGAVCQGFVESFLESHLALFGLSVTQVGVSFLAMSVPYMLATPVWGWLGDTRLPPQFISPAGNFIILVSLLLVGPAAYLPLQPDYLLTEVGLAGLGVGTAATLTATFALAQQAANPDGDKSAQSVISGLWTSAFAFGQFRVSIVGPDGKNKTLSLCRKLSGADSGRAAGGLAGVYGDHAGAAGVGGGDAGGGQLGVAGPARQAEQLRQAAVSVPSNGLRGFTEYPLRENKLCWRVSDRITAPSRGLRQPAALHLFSILGLYKLTIVAQPKFNKPILLWFL